MLIEWLIVGAIVAVSLYYAVRSIARTLGGGKACCAEGDKAGCQLVGLMKEHNLPKPTTCNGRPVTDPEAVAGYKRRMAEKRRAVVSREGEQGTL